MRFVCSRLNLPVVSIELGFDCKNWISVADMGYNRFNAKKAYENRLVKLVAKQSILIDLRT